MSILSPIPPNPDDFTNVILNKILQIFVDSLSGKVIYIPSDRKMPTYEHYIPFIEFELKADKDHYIRHFLFYLMRNNPVAFKDSERELELSFGKITIVPKLNYKTGNIDIAVNQDDIIFDINEMGSGFRYFLLILTRILYSDASVILIDEPDLNMHASLINDFAHYLQRFTKKQIIVSSHNETFVNEIDISKIRRVRSINPIFTTVSPLQEKELDQLITDLGITITNFNKSLLLSSKVVPIVEGNDEEYLRSLIARAGLTDRINSLNITFLKTGNSETIDSHVIDLINNKTSPFGKR